MKHQYEDYIKFCEQRIENRKTLIFQIERMTTRHPDLLDSESKTKIQNARIEIASLLANKATLERHKPEEVGGQVFCFACESDTEYDNNHLFPCPSLLDVTNQLDLVMGASND